MVEETNCDAIMIGRAAATNPWIFRQIAQLAAGAAPVPATDADRYHMIRDYYRLLVEEGHPEATGKMKQLAQYFTHGVRNGAHLRRAIHQSRSAPEILACVDEFFASTLATVRLEG